MECLHEKINLFDIDYSRYVKYKDSTINYFNIFRCAECLKIIEFGDIPSLDNLFLSLLDINKQYQDYTLVWKKVSGKIIEDRKLLSLVDSLKHRLEDTSCIIRNLTVSPTIELAYDHYRMYLKIPLGVMRITILS